jgi:hypothetical protein
MILTKTYPANKSLTKVFDELFDAFPTTGEMMSGVTQPLR